MRILRTIVAATALLSAIVPAAADSLQANLKRHSGFICDPALEGRKAGSDGEKKAARYLYDRLEELGVTMLCNREGDTFTIITSEGDTIVSQNIVGIIEGTDTALRNEYIVVGTHTDHLGSYTVNVNGTPQKRIYPGADANASGMAVLIETARILALNREALGRSVLFLGFGAMEEEFSGSRYFASEGGFSHIGDVKMMVNLDMLGRGTKENPFEIYAPLEHTPVSRIANIVRESESVTSMPAIHSGMVFPSDNLAFRQAGVPALTFSTGICREYRTVRDTPELLQFDNMAAETVYIAAFVKALSNLADLEQKEKSAEERVYALSECDTPPRFFRHDVNSFLNDWVYKYLKYPQQAISEGIQGTVLVSFTVEANGAVDDVRIERGVSESLDAEALKVVSASPKWTPGTLDGKKVRTKIVIPVEFRLKKR